MARAKKLRTRGKIIKLYGGPAWLHEAARRINAGTATRSDTALVYAFFVNLRPVERRFVVAGS